MMFEVFLGIDVWSCLCWVCSALWLMLSSLHPRWVLWLWVSQVESASESEPSMATGVPGRKYFGRVAAGTKPYLSLILRFALPFETKPFACKCALILWVDSLVYRGHWRVRIDLHCLLRPSLWPVRVLTILRVDTLVCWWCWRVCIAAMASVSSSIPLFSFCYFRFPPNKQTNTSFLGLNLHLAALSPLSHSHLLDPVDTVLNDTHSGMLWLNLRVALVD